MDSLPCKHMSDPKLFAPLPAHGFPASTCQTPSFLPRCLPMDSLLAHVIPRGLPLHPFSHLRLSGQFFPLFAPLYTPFAPFPRPKLGGRRGGGGGGGGGEHGGGGPSRGGRPRGGTIECPESAAPGPHFLSPLSVSLRVFSSGLFFLYLAGPLDGGGKGRPGRGHSPSLRVFLPPSGARACRSAAPRTQSLGSTASRLPATAPTAHDTLRPGPDGGPPPSGRQAPPSRYGGGGCLPSCQ